MIEQNPLIPGSCRLMLPLLCFEAVDKAGANTFRSADYVKITIFGFALSALWSSLHSIVLPLRLLDFVAESQKNTYLGLLTFAGLVLAMLVQPVAGAVSDHSGFRWGRRRPYILLGAMLLLLFLPGIALVGSYAAIFAVYCVLQISANIAQVPYQAFIPDLVAEERRGLASGVKSLMEIVGGVAMLYLVAVFMDRYSTQHQAFWLWLVLATLGGILLAAMVATMLLVKERAGNGPQLRWSTLYRSYRVDFRGNRNFLWFLISRLLILMAFTTIQTFALYFLRDIVGVADPAAATARFSLVAVAGMLAVVYPAGRFSDRVGRRAIAAGAGVLGALSVALIFLFQHSYTLVMAGGGLIGLAFGAFLSTNWAMATDLVAKGEEARYLGLTNLATAGGSALARLIGPVIDFFSVYSVGLGYSIMLLACFIYFLAGSALLIKVRRPALN